jgi:ABC-type polysaccharide/polyol phosphate export permease
VIPGVLWPLEGAPIFIQILAKTLPFSATLNAIRSIAIKGSSIDDKSVQSAFITLLLWIPFALSIIIILIKTKLF